MEHHDRPEVPQPSTPTPHPLLIDHVVENILISLPCDLFGHYCKIFRLVSKPWADVGTRLYCQRRGRMVFKRNFIGKVSALFIRIMRTSLIIPFSSFKFCPDSYDEEYFSQVLHVCSGAIVSLELNIVVSSGGKSNNCPRLDLLGLILGRLRTLIFHVRVEEEEVGNLEEVACLLKTLLAISPHLTTLDLKVLRRKLSNAPTTIGDILSKHLPSTVRSLKLYLTLSEGQLRDLNGRECLSQLKRLDLYLQQSQVERRTLEEFFSKCCSSLVTCRAVGNQFQHEGGGRFFSLPVFPQLKNLSAVGRTPEWLKYAQVFPNLSRLDVSLWDSGTFGSIFPPWNCYSASLRHVNLPFHVQSPTLFQRMGSTFPNLTKLTEVTVSNPEALGGIFKWLRNLQVLEIVLGYDFQSSSSRGEGGGVTGLDYLFCGEGRKSLVLPPTPLSFEDSESSDSSSDCIRNLKDLRCFNLTAAPLTTASSIKITDVSVYYGFLQLKKLAVITLDYFPISAPCLEVLEKKVRLRRPV